MPRSAYLKTWSSRKETLTMNDIIGDKKEDSTGSAI
jgi:hypothetical protein